MKMAKLSPAQVKALREAVGQDGGHVNTHTTKARTLEALYSRFLIKREGGSAVITPSGRTALDEYERAERAQQERAERASRPVPASAFVEPSAAKPVHAFPEYEDEPEESGFDHEDDCAECVPAVGQAQIGHGDNGKGAPTPAVQLTPRPEHVEQEATDAEILQLLAMLDHGASVHRGLYQEYGVLDAGPFRLNLDAVNRAARDAVRFGLARQTYSNRLYVLEVEPVHLLTGDGQVTPCGRYPVAARNSGKRLRVTADPSKVTHDFCQR